MTDPKLTMDAVGAELRSVVTHLESVASHVTTCRLALEAQSSDDDIDVANVLRASVGVLLHSQTRRLARLASRCDGKPVDDDDDDAGADDGGDE